MRVVKSYINFLSYAAVFALLFGLVLDPAQSTLAAPGDPDDWQLVGDVNNPSSGDDTKPYTAVINGMPYLAASDASYGYRTSVKRFNGTTWEYVGTPGFTSGSAEYRTLVASGNNIYLVYRDDANSRKLSAQRFNGTAWEYVGTPGFTPSMVWLPTATVYNGTLYVAFSDDDADGGLASVMRFNGTAWEYVGTPGFSGVDGYFGNIDIAINQGTPYVAYDDCSLADCYTSVMRFNGTTWEYVGTKGFTGDYTIWNSLAFDSNNIPYVAFVDAANDFKASVMRFNGTAWEYVGTPGFTPGEADDIGFMIHEDVLYISFADFANSWHNSVMRFNGTAWEYVGTPGFSGQSVGGSSTILQSADYLYVAGSSGYIAKFDLDYQPTSNTLELPNSTDGKNVFVQTPDATNITCGEALEESIVNTDSQYDYPLGLINFCFTTAELDNEVSLTFVTNLKATEVVPRKYNPLTQKYATIDNAVITEVEYEGQSALTIVYDVTDNGPLDTNTTLGEIDDPVGLAVLQADDPEIGVPNTGLTQDNAMSSLLLAAIGMIGLVLAWLVARRFYTLARTK